VANALGENLGGEKVNADEDKKKKRKSHAQWEQNTDKGKPNDFTYCGRAKKERIEIKEKNLL